MWECIQTREQPTEKQIPFIYHEATLLAEHNYDFELLQRKYPSDIYDRKAFPPRVHYTLNHESEFTMEEVTPKRRRELKKVVVKVVMALMMVAILMSFIPKVET